VFGKLKKIASNGKDHAVSLAVQKAFDHNMKGIGKMLEFRLDSQKKTIHFTVMLEGEHEPLEVTVERYTILNEGTKSFILIDAIKTSRKWIDVLSSQYLVGKKMELPQEYANIIAMIV